MRWRLASSFPAVLATINESTRGLAERVSALTDGGFSLELFAAGELVPALGVMPAVRDGTVECGHTASYYYTGTDPTFAFDTALPFGLNARQQNAWMYAGGGHELYQEFLRDFGLVSLPAGNSGAQMAGWYRDPIRGVEDLDGLRLRIGGWGAEVFARLGVLPQQLPLEQVLAELQAGRIDAAEWGGPLDDEALGFHEVVRNYYFPGWWDGGAQLSLMINRDAWQALAPTHRAALEAACAEANVRMLARYDAGNPAALRRLVDQGVRLRAFPREVMQAAHDAAFALYEETAAVNPAFERVYRQWLAFRKESDLWFRVAENTFDNFKYAQGSV